MARPTRSSLRDLLPTLQQVGSRRFSALSGTRLYANSLSQPLIRPSLAPSTNSFGGNPSRPWDPTEIYIPTTRRIRRFSSYRGFPNTGPETAFWILLGLNVIPFLAWNAISFSNAPWANKMRWFMEDHFLFKESAGKAKPWTILTSGFSHVSIAHFGFNMFSLYTCTKILGITTSLGTASVLGLQIAGILGGNLASVYMQRNAVAAAKAKGDTRAARQIAMRSSLGASGGVSACLVAGACYAPMFKVHAMFIPIPIPLAVFAGLYMLFDTYNVGNTMSKTGHEAHVGGGITGALFWLLFKGR